MSSFTDPYPKAEIEDRRTAKTVKRDTARKAAPVAFALMLGWCGHQATAPTAQAPQPPAQEVSLKVALDDVGDFVARVQGENDRVWKEQLGAKWKKPRMVLYTATTETEGCGEAQTAIGPFYCPNPDRRIYLDASFFAELRTKACAQESDACRFARAYVIAHENGHHVQNLLGILAKADKALMQQGPEGASVHVELQADCLAGMWAGLSNMKWGNLKQPHITAAWQAARFGGDDRFGVPKREYTHGTSEQRSRWFLKGYDGRAVKECDTFGKGVVL